VSTVREAQPWELISTVDEDVADSRSAARWSVQERGWKQVLPELPDDVIALLATPVVVRAHSIAAPEASTVGQADKFGATTPPRPGNDERVARFLAPAPPRRHQPRRARRP
jgi:hypothetical protein